MRRAASLLGAFALASLATTPAQASVDSYRFMHVTIETPWHLFLFLLVGVLSPFILMVALIWRYAWRRWGHADPKAKKQSQAEQ
jgi:uncharacterized membrane protein